MKHADFQNVLDKFANKRLLRKKMVFGTKISN